MEEINFSTLPKKERKKLKQEMERQEEEKRRKTAKMVKWLIIALLVLLGIVGGWFLFKELAKPLPGRVVEDQGRSHVTKEQWEKFSYNSNPPTSGPHDPIWIRGGVYSEPQGDGYLVHSLEHGYIIISYNCEKLSNCEELKRNLADVANKKGLTKLILVPRKNQDMPIALTAWTRIDKMDEFDKTRIERFIDTFRNRGPEKTVE